MPNRLPALSGIQGGVLHCLRVALSEGLTGDLLPAATTKAREVLNEFVLVANYWNQLEYIVIPSHSGTVGCVA